MGIFSKGLVYGFGQEGECFSFFFVFVKIRHVSVFDSLLRLKRRKVKKKKSINWDFSKVISPWFLVKNLKFSNVCILDYRENMPGNVFTIFKKEKKPF